MPRKATTKKAVSKRTYTLPANVAEAFDALVSHFDEDKDRVARRFFEDGLRKIARDHSLDAVLGLLGDQKPNPFESFAQRYQEPYAGSAPVYTPPFPVLPTYEPVTMPPVNSGDLVLPSVGPRAPRESLSEE